MPNANDPFDDKGSPLLFGAGDDIYPIDGGTSYVSDTVDLPTAVRALRVTVAGNIQVTMRNGEVRVLAFAAAETRYGRFIRVWSTNTTATGIEGHV